MAHQDYMIIQNLHQNNLKNISLEISKEKIVVFYRSIWFRKIKYCIRYYSG